MELTVQILGWSLDTNVQQSEVPSLLQTTSQTESSLSDVFDYWQCVTAPVPCVIPDSKWETPEMKTQQWLDGVKVSCATVPHVRWAKLLNDFRFVSKDKRPPKTSHAASNTVTRFNSSFIFKVTSNLCRLTLSVRVSVEDNLSRNVRKQGINHV